MGGNRSRGRADRTLKVGDAWVYQTRDVRTGETRELSFLVTAVEADTIVTETGLSTSGAWTFTREWNPVERKTGDVITMSIAPSWPQFAFPLEIGRSWEAPFTNDVILPTGTRHVQWQWKGRVVGAEEVTVAAGRFQTLKIVSEATFTSRQGNRSWTGSHKDTTWYAPDVKRFVRRDYEMSVPQNNFQEHVIFELLSYKLTP